MLGHDDQEVHKTECGHSNSLNNKASGDQDGDTVMFIPHHSTTVQDPEPPPVVTVPPAITTTAHQINHLSYMNKAARRRAKRLTPEWKSARQKVSNNSITHILSIPELDKVQKERMSTSSTLRAFETNNATVKDRRTREILTRRTYAGLAASQRRFFQDAGKNTVSL